MLKKLQLLLIVAVALLLPVSVGAQQQGIDDEDPDQGLCDQTIELITTLKTTGQFLPGATIGIQADPLVVKVQAPSPANPHVCGVSSFPVPAGKWSWQIIERPPFSTSQLAGMSGKAVTLLLDRVGVFRIRFTACASGCEFKLADQTTLAVAPEIREVVIRVLSRLPPEKSPLLPPSALVATTATRVPNHCSFGVDWLSTPWHTVEVWTGAANYRLLEGEVVESTIASADNDLNHSSQDWGVNVTPDPRHRILLNRNFAEQDTVEVEWERVRLPEKFRPSDHDRVSAIGYWIYDCAHGPKTEIHPPVLLAVHRPRAVALPSSAGAGSNVIVPGIVTDIWVNPKAGTITDDCDGLGLKQQIDPSKPVLDTQGHPISRCLPDSEGFSSNPINRQYQFNIYLPRSPQAVMAAIGRTAPRVPLFRAVSNPNGSAGPDPVIQEVTEGNVTFLRVSINLRNYPQQTYSRRIVAAWAHAAPDNWGARSWNVRITSMNISDDADSRWRGDGDWRFWVNTNNGDTEWVKLFDCDGCAHGNETFEGIPWETKSQLNHRLGPPVILFPNQNIQLVTSGFEDDWTYEDSIARLHLKLAQLQVTNGSAIATDGDGKYTMHYQVLPGADVGRALLSREAQARYDAYSLTTNDVRGLGADTLAVLDASFSDGTSKPNLAVVLPTAERERQSQSFETMSVTELREAIQRAQREEPAALDAFFRELEQSIQRGKNAHREQEIVQFLRAVKPAIPAALWQKHGFEKQLLNLSRTQ